jgi:hypothetical protein
VKIRVTGPCTEVSRHVGSRLIGWASGKHSYLIFYSLETTVYMVALPFTIMSVALVISISLQAK